VQPYDLRLRGDLLAHARREPGDNEAIDIVREAPRTLARPGGLGEPMPQEGEPTYAAKVTPADLELDWSRPAEELGRLPRVGKAWTVFRGHRLIVVQARAVKGDGPPGVIDGVTVWAGEGGLELLRVQPEGKGVVDAVAWRNGARPQPGERLGA